MPSKPSVLDVAKYILQVAGPMTTMKLQKIVYYCQAWSIVWDDDSLFDEEIEAWEMGPVCRSLFNKHKGKFRVCESDLGGGNVQVLTEDQRRTIEAVIKFYGKQSAQWLSDLTHIETPWKEAFYSGRKQKVISKESMAEYYGSLQKK
ncbi:hypothetical protein DS66_05025 [Mesotoga sp. SC_3PWM13N19]|jgi:uncharacterized phage-associated protein|uniref:Panacea domain-containing protein n=1 Tax=Mesotoga sp. UBA5847 TaxID=1946859 RepID=UPI000DBF7B13|nr:type II toxin-antitoxin system antitoxin SocA domain-containing protein [Mesotoga sp. UBA5847]RAM65112.1 hypothetical protein DS66_05025 [Mesotoga sp. SC_3PWM13N19]